MENEKTPMEKQKPQEDQKTRISKPNNITNNNNKKQQHSRPLWDCGSTLYDSFELNSFQKQLDSAIISSSRTFSMPRLPSQGGGLPPPPPPPPPPEKKPIPTSTSKISRSFRKLLKSVLGRSSRPNHSTPDSSGPEIIGPWVLDHQRRQVAQSEKGKGKEGDGKYFVVYEKVNGLSTIPEVAEVPEIGGSLVRKTRSERFTSNSISIYCS